MTRLTDKELRRLLRDEGYFGTQDRLEDHAREFATEVLELRKVRRAAEAFVVNIGTQHANRRFDALGKALKLDRPRGKRAKEVR